MHFYSALFFFSLAFFFLLCFRANPGAYGIFQAAAAGWYHSHIRSKLHLLKPLSQARDLTLVLIDTICVRYH